MQKVCHDLRDDDTFLPVIVRMQGMHNLDGVFKQFTGCLVSSGQTSIAVKLTHYGHVVGALKHYQHVAMSQDALESEDQIRMAGHQWNVDLKGCKAEGVGIILLAWSFDLSQAIAQGLHPLTTQAIGFEFGELQVSADSFSPGISHT